MKTSTSLDSITKNLQKKVNMDYTWIPIFLKKTQFKLYVIKKNLIYVMKSDEATKVCEMKSTRFSTTDSDTRQRAFKSVEMAQK